MLEWQSFPDTLENTRTWLGSDRLQDLEEMIELCLDDLTTDL